MQRIAVMQGRMTPPVGDRIQCFPCEHWRQEFALASRAEIEAIEWIYDLYGEAGNPVRTDSGIREMRALSKENQIGVVSLCADYFMERPFLRTTQPESMELFSRLCWLLRRCRLSGITRIVLPFVDNSSIRTVEEEEDVSELLRAALPIAEGNGVEIHLETSLPPRRFASLLSKLPSRLIKVTYDSGNSACLGYDVGDEFAAYGDRVGSVHIKDRARVGKSVPLGEDSADFGSILKALQGLGYDGNFVLQVARGQSGKEVEWIGASRSFLVAQMQLARTVCEDLLP